MNLEMLDKVICFFCFYGFYIYLFFLFLKLITTKKLKQEFSNTKKEIVSFIKEAIRSIKIKKDASINILLSISFILWVLSILIVYAFRFFDNY